MVANASEGVLGVDGLLAVDARVRHRIYLPPPKLTVSEWADRYRILNRAASAEPGKWRTDRAPYQREIMDACCDPTIEEVVVMKPSQVGFTEILGNVLGYYIDQDPAPILVVQPNLEMARAWSLDRVTPMLRDSPKLRGVVTESNRRSSGDTILHKVFSGGHLTIVGANSAAGLASRPIRIALFDEVDRYPHSAGNEGDPVTLGRRRTATFWNRKIIRGSTPTLKGESKIEKAYEQSDQRRYFVPCPACGHEQVLVWAGLKWDEGDPKSVRYACAGCGVLIGEEQKGRMVAAGRWVAGEPGRSIAGFHLNALISPWAPWSSLVEEWLSSQHDMTKLQAFVNTILGETWEERGGGLNPDGLRARREMYAATVPLGVGLLTAGVDIQDDRIEATLWGWGAGEESWIIKHHRLLGDPQKPDVWGQLDAVLFAAYPHESGATIGIAATCVDSGAHTEAVYRYCRQRTDRRVYPTKGASEAHRPVVEMKGSKVGRLESRVRLFMVGTDAAKDRIYGMLRVAMPGALYVHLPHDLPDDVIDQLTSEKVMRRQMPGGRWIRRYECPRGVRNEALDCAVLALAAQRLSPVRPARLERAVQRVADRAQPPAEVPVDEPSLEVPAVMAPPAPPRRRGIKIVGRMPMGRFR